MRTAGTVLAITTLLLLAGCGGPADGDQVACDTFAGAHNTMTSAVNDYGNTDAGGTTAEREAVIAASAAIPGQIDNALLVVDDPQLKILLTDTVDMTGRGGAQTDDMGMAYFLLTGQVFERCRDLGVDIEEVEIITE